MKQISIASYSRISLYILCLVCSFVCFAGCTKEYTTTDKNASSTSSSAAVATIIDQHVDFPGPYDLVNQCTGETVTVTGTIGDDLHIVMNGNRVNLSEHQSGILVGTGSLGNSYRTILNENVAFNGLLSNGAFVINDITNFKMLSQGSAPDFTVQRLGQLTVNANGVVTHGNVTMTTSCH